MSKKIGTLPTDILPNFFFYNIKKFHLDLIFENIETNYSYNNIIY
jgi:hypothetical protein